MKFFYFCVALAAGFSLQAAGSSHTFFPFSVSQLAALAYVILMARSALGFYLMKQAYGNSVPNIFYGLHTSVVLWSGLMYINFIFNTPFAPYALYADWVITTPLMVLALALTAMVQAPTISWSLLLIMMGLQSIGILTGLMGEFCEPLQATLTFFTVGKIAIMAVLYTIWGPLRDIAKSSSRELLNIFQTLVYFVSIFWVTVPLIWLLGTPGLKILSVTTTDMMFVIVPLIAKVGFAYLNLFLLNQLSHEVKSPLRLMI